MTAHGDQEAPPEQTEQENVQDKSTTETYDDKLARDLYKDHSSQNAVTIQLMLAGAAGGIFYCRAVIDAYNLLKRPLDPEKLLTDPIYKARVKRATQLVQRHEGKKRIENGKSKYSEIIPKTQTALERVEATHSHLRSDKSVLLTNKSAYLAHIQTFYGFDEKQMKQLAAGAWERIKERPTLSMHEALRIEAEGLSIRQVRREVDKDSKGKKLTKKQKEEEVQRRLSERKGMFEEAAGKWIRWEDETRGKPIIDQGLRQTADALGVELKPTTTTPQVPVTRAPAPSITTPSIPTPSIPSGFSIPSRFKTGFSNISSRFNSLSGGLKGNLSKIFGGLTKGFNSLFSKAVSKGIGLAIKAGTKIAAKLGLKLVGQAIASALPIAGNIIFGIAQFLGLDELFIKFALYAALFAVGAVFAVSFVVFLIGLAAASEKIPSFGSGENAMKVSLKKEINLSWQEFEKKYLTIPGLSRALSDEEKKY